MAVSIGDDGLWEEEEGVEEGRVLDGECRGKCPQLRGLGVSGSHWDVRKGDSKPLAGLMNASYDTVSDV